MNTAKSDQEVYTAADAGLAIHQPCVGCGRPLQVTQGRIDSDPVFHGPATERAPADRLTPVLCERCDKPLGREHFQA